MTTNFEAQTLSPVRAYVSLARLDHVTKHVFIIPGIVLCLLLRDGVAELAVSPLVFGFLSAVAIASANYVLNEWLDREFDAHHPLKRSRPSVRYNLSPTIVYAEYASLVAVGLVLASAVNGTFFVFSVVFTLAGIAYNVRPLRTKDRFVVDVLSESLNNPIRLMLGWSMVDPTSLPPVSLVLGYWMGGAYLMNAKRLSEYRDVLTMTGRDQLVRYRRSFALYNENRLLVACMVYSMMSGFFTAVFLIKFRIEYVLLLPFLGMLFAVYFALALRPQSLAQAPERLFQSRLLMTTAALTAAAFGALSYVDIAVLDPLTGHRYITVGSPFGSW